MPKKKPIEEFQNSLWKLLASAEEEWIGSRDRALTRYEQEYRADTENSGRKNNLSQLARAISKAQLVFVGDDHALCQSRESFLFLVQRAKKRKKRFALGLEMVHAEDQKVLDKYLEGSISETEFLRQTRYWERWGFDWSSYRKILSFAKKEKIPAIALNSESRGEDPLHRRDEKAASLIANYLNQHSGTSLFVLFGEQHISESHLPCRVDEKFRREGLECRSLIIHQFSTPEDAQHSNSSRTRVYRMGERAFRLVSSSPLATLSSHLEWLELGSRASDRNLDREEIRAMMLDRIHSVGLALSVLLEQESSVLDRFEILFPEEAKQMLHANGSFPLSEKEIETLQWEMKHLPALAIPRTPFVVMNDTSFPTVCEAAGQLLARGEDKLPHDPDILLYFCARAFRTGLGYFSSKLFDPYRTPKPAHQWIQPWSEEQHEEISAWKNEFRDFLRAPQNLPRFSNQLRSLSRPLQHAACRSIGEIFGTKIYRSFTNGNVQADDLRDLFRAANGPQNGMISAFLGFLRRTDSVSP